MKRENPTKLTEKVKSVDIKNFFESIDQRKRKISIITADQIDLDGDDEEEDELSLEVREEEDDVSVELEIFDEDLMSDGSLSIEFDDDLPSNPDPTPTQAPSIEESLMPSIPVMSPTQYDSDIESDSEEEETRRQVIIESIQKKKRLKTMDWLQADQNSQDLLTIIQKESQSSKNSNSAPKVSDIMSLLDSQFDESARDSFEPELFRDCTQDSFDDLRKSELSRLIPKSNTTITFASASLFQNSNDGSSQLKDSPSDQSNTNSRKRKGSIMDGLNKNV